MSGGLIDYASLADDVLIGLNTIYARLAGPNTLTGTWDFTTATVTGIAGGGGGAADKLGLTPTAVKTTNYTAAAGDFVPVDTTGGNITVTFPTAPVDGAVVAVKHAVRGGTNTVTLTLGGSDKFNTTGGANTGTLALVSQGIVAQYKTSLAVWYVIADDLPLSGLDARYDAAGAATTAQGNSLQKASNLSDVASPATTRTNLGLVAVAASGSATDLTAGSVPAARFGATTVPVSAINATGSASSTTYLRGDGTWTAPANLGTPNTQTGTTYTLVLADANKVMEGNNASAVTVTVPPNSSVAFAVGDSIVIRQYGAGQVSVAAGAGVTIRSRGGSLSLVGQYSEATVTKRATDEWVLSGDLA